MQRWHLAFFARVNSGSFFSPLPFTGDPKWLFLCLCRETNRSGCKWKELLFIHKQGASSQDPSQPVSLGYLEWEQNAKQSPWGFHQATGFVGPKSPQGLVHCSRPFCILHCLQVLVVVSFPPHKNKDFSRKRKQKQPLNVTALGAQGECTHRKSTKPLA